MMKKFSELSWQVDEKTYRKDEAYSQSVITKFDREGFESLKTLYDHVDTPQLRFGSLVDCIITGSKEEFNERYFVVDFPKMTDSLEQISKELFKRYCDEYDSFDKIPDEILSSIGAECGYYENSKYEKKRVESIRKNCGKLYDLMFLAKGKECISSKEMDKAMECVHALFEDKITGPYFVKDDFSHPGIEHYYQLKFKTVENGIPLKCMADLIIVDHNNKVVQPIDLKTSGHPEYMFHKSFIKWKYWVQAQLYWYLIRKAMDNDDQYKEYKLLDYKFIVISRDNPHPLVWTYTDTTANEDLTYGKDNRILCRHWRNIVKELDYYMKSNNVQPLGIKEDNDIKEWLNKE